MMKKNTLKIIKLIGVFLILSSSLLTIFISKAETTTPLTDYKFWYIMRNDNGQINEVAVRYYEGIITTKSESLFDGSTTTITRYHRTKRLQELDLPQFGNAQKKLEVNGNVAVLYTQKDFGTIYTDDELRLFLDKELAKDLKRTPIREQTSKTTK